MSIREETIDAIRARADIVAVVSEHVALKKRGRNFVGLCPFHKEKTPSFTVFPERQSWHCFGCGQGGNVFTFLMQVEHLTFPEAVERLGRSLGIQVTRERESAERRTLRQQILEVNEAAATFFARCLKQTPAALDLFRRRGLSERSIEEFALGYAPPHWDALCNALLRRGVTAAILEKAGLARARSTGGYYDYFRDRLIFPIRDVEGRVVGFGGRATGDAQPKYLNSPETPVFDKSRTLYGLDLARHAILQTGLAIVVEGYMDVVMAQQEGVRNVVATLGTALGQAHLEVLRRYTSRVVLAYDGDDAGAKAAERSLPLFQNVELEGRILVLPFGQDPDDFIRQRGPEAFRDAVTRALPLVEFQIRRVTARADKSTPEGRAALIRAAAAILAMVRHHPQQEEYVRRLAEEWSEGKPFAMQHIAEALWREIRRGQSKGDTRAVRALSSGENTSRAGAEPPPSQRVVRAEALILQGLLSGVTTPDEVFEIITPEDFLLPPHRNLARVLWAGCETTDPLETVRRACGPEGGPLEGLASRLLAEQEKLPITSNRVMDCVWVIKEKKVQKRISELQLQLAALQDKPGEERTRVEKELYELKKVLSDRKAG